MEVKLEEKALDAMDTIDKELITLKTFRNKYLTDVKALGFKKSLEDEIELLKKKLEWLSVIQ